MDFWDNWKFSSEAEDRLNKICAKLALEGTSEISSDFLSLLNYKSCFPENCQMEADNGEVDKTEEILQTVKLCVESDSILPEATFVGISVNSLNKILLSVNKILDEYGFCFFCKFIASWNNCVLVESSLRSVVFEKLKETSEATGCIIFSIKELAISKPEEFCQNVLIPLLTSDTKEFTDVELLSAVFSVLPASQKDFTIRKFTKKTEFLENDWKLLHPLIKDLSQNGLLILLECIQKFSHKFVRSSVFGRFLVNFCRNIEFCGNRDILREVVEKHETLLKTQAMKYLESV